MADSIPRDIPTDERGNLDILKELEVLKYFEELGIDISDMEYLLFRNIDEYISQRDRIIDLLEDGDLIESDLYKNRAKDIEEPVENNLNNDELLLVGSPLEPYDISDQGQDLDIDRDDDIPEKKIEDSFEGEIETQNKTKKKIESVKKQKKKSSSPKIEEEITASKKEKTREGMSEKDQWSISNRTGHHNRKKIKPIFFTLTILIMLLIASSIGYYLIEIENENEERGLLSAEFDINDINPLAGDVINITTKYYDIDNNYAWNILPEKYEIVDGDPGSRSLELFFKEPGEYRIDLSVTNNKDTVDKSRLITVKNINIGVTRERFGDLYSYDVLGEIRMKNIQGLFNENEVSSFRDLNIDYWTENDNPMKIEIGEGSVMEMDGLSREFKRASRLTNHFIRFSGTVKMTDGTKTTITGSSNTEQENILDLYTKRPVVTHSNIDMDVFIPIKDSLSIDRSLEKSVDLYPDLSSDLSDLRIEDLSEGRNFSIGDEGSARWGSTTLFWTAQYADIINNKRCIKLDFIMDESSKRTMDIDSFQMEHWIDEFNPVPLKSIINISSEDNIKNPYELFHEQILSNYVQGEKIIIYGSQEYKHVLLSSISDIDDIFENEFHSNWNMIPEVGSIGGTFNSAEDPREQLELVKEKPSYRTWASDNDNAFVVYFNLSNFNDADVWKYSMSEKEKEWGYNATVINGISEGFIRRIDPVDLDREEIPKILTFSASEYALKTLISEIDEKTAIDLYGRSSPSMSDGVLIDHFSIGTRVDHDYPIIGIFNPTMYRPMEMCMVIESYRNDLSIGLDMTNGQISYIQRSHTINN